MTKKEVLHRIPIWICAILLGVFMGLLENIFGWHIWILNIILLMMMAWSYSYIIIMWEREINEKD